MVFSYKPQGVCAKRIDIELSGEKIVRAEFLGGCDGSSKAICALIAGKDARDMAALLCGITCEHRSTSCPDQLSKALIEALNSEAVL